MSSINKIINFYKDCYLNDFKAISISNFMGNNVEYQYYLNSFEPINGQLLDYPIDSEWGKIIDKELALNSKEKGLYAGVFFLKGKMDLLGKPRKVFTPLYLYEVQLNSIDGIYSIELNLNNPIINPSFLNFIKSIDDTIDISYDEFSESFPKGILDFDAIYSIKKNLKAISEKFNIDDIDNLVKNEIFENKLSSIHKSKSLKYTNTILASISIGLIKKPKGSRGVINELDTLSQNKIDSDILKSIFFINKSKYILPRKNKEIINAPVSLSDSQKQVFSSIANSNITLVIGPPGTGKSFTIAAISADLISKGKSVLISSKNNQAGKVISNKIENDLGLKGLVIKTSRKSYKRSLKTKLTNILNGISIKKVNSTQLQSLKEKINYLNYKIKSLITQLKKRGQEEISWGYFFYKFNNSFLSRLQKKWIIFKLKRREPIWKIKNTIDFLEKKRIEKITKYIKYSYNSHLYQNILKKRDQIKHLIKALEEDAGNLINQEFEKIDFNTLLKALPVWICNTADIHNILPLKEKLFDVVIIDEATQCDIASTIPLLYRAKKIVIVGDPNQLKHISFLSKQQEKTLRLKYNLDESILGYRTNSILDLVNNSINNQDQVMFLNEHYRSSPDIINFSNNMFYADNLNIMTESPINNVNKNIVLKRINGHRTTNGTNIKEAEFILNEINSIIKRESNINKKLCTSVGIISPYRQQINFLKTLIRKHISLNDFKRHNILIGTPYHFQGEERDYIFISFVVDNDTHPSAIMYLNREDVFNVSITRARNKQIVCTSLDYETLSGKFLLSQYLNSIGQIQRTNRELSKINDKFANDISEYIHSINDVTEVLMNYPVAGVDIDLVVVKNKITYCIDLIGYPGIFENQFSHTKINILNRMNHPVFFVSYSSWNINKQKCKKAILNFLENKTGNY